MIIDKINKKYLNCWDHTKNYRKNKWRRNSNGPKNIAL